MKNTLLNKTKYLNSSSLKITEGAIDKMANVHKKRIFKINYAKACKTKEKKI